jgi:16S rRNA (cytosine967-C5)-methyltransferase
MIAPARLVSYQILLQIATSDAHSDELLRSAEVDALSAQDRHLTTTLVLGTLRWQLELDARIRGLLARPDAKLAPEVAAALRMGAFQLGYLDRVPAHAVINDSVELVKQGKEKGAAGMVNAVLRKVMGTGTREQSAAERRTADSGQRIENQGQASGAIAAAWAHPAWMVERWVRRYGSEAAEAICRWDQEPAGICLRVVEGDQEPEGVETEAGHFLSAARRLVRGDLGRSVPVRDGRVRVQDEGSQLVAEVLAAQANFVSAGPAAPLRVLDTCAAPGGKTAILAERLAGAEITAVDVSRSRVLAVRGPGGTGRTLRESGPGRVHWEVADVTKMELKPEWDLVLCDVPCSGTGTMARNPEIRLRVKQEDLARQHRRQVAILRAGLEGLKPGGRLVYSTCSLEAEENEEVVAEALGATTGFRVVPVEGILDRLGEDGIVTADGRERLRGATEGDFLRTLPGVHPCDGFFAAVLEKNQGTGNRQ